MSGPLEELKRLSSKARSNKGRMDADSRKQAAALLQVIWTNPAHDPRATLPYLADLKAEALADAIEQSWPKMDSERRTLFERWLPPPGAERDIRRLAFLTGSVVETDPSTAIRWLIRLVPADRKSPTKETRQHLAAGLLRTSLGFHGFALATVQAAEILRVYKVLWEIATDPEFDVPMMARVRLAKAILGFASASDGTAAGSVLEYLQSQIQIESRRWPAPLRSEFEGLGERSQPQEPVHSSAAVSLGEIRAEGKAQQQLEQTTPAADILEPSAVIVSSGDASADTHDSPQGGGSPNTPSGDYLAVRIDARLAQIPLEVDLFRDLQRVLSQNAAESQAHKLQREELAETRRALSEIRSAFDVACRERDQGRDETRREKARAEELEAKLAQLARDAEDERRRLGQQISANASGRIEEFKNRLASSLSRLVKDLPAARTDVSLELGKILLLQFHQFLEALRQEGISVRAGAES